MPGFTESNITLNFPDNNFFRIADCKSYKALSGNHFKEMDACWFDASENLYWMIELKDYSSANLSSSQTIEQLSWDIVKKAVDSLCLFLSSKHNYPYSQEIPCFSNTPNEMTQLKIITIIHCDNSRKPDVQAIHNKFRIKFRPYSELFGIKYYAVVEHSQAARMIPNNIILE